MNGVSSHHLASVPNPGTLTMRKLVNEIIKMSFLIHNLLIQEIKTLMDQIALGREASA